MDLNPPSRNSGSAPGPCPVWQIADAKMLEEVQRKALSLCLDCYATSEREAMEVELGVKPLSIRRQELAIREGAKIISKSEQVPIKKSWLYWKENIDSEKKKVQVGKDQEKAQSEKDSHSKNRGGKKPN